MDASNEEIVALIKAYQERLDKYVTKSNEEKILYYLNKLKKLPIKTVHLETTGVGRSVNALKKLGGAVGNAAKEVVASWKMMVLAEEQAAKEAEEIAEDADSAVESDSGNSEDALNIDEVHSSHSVQSEPEIEEPKPKQSSSRDDDQQDKPSKDKHRSGSHSKKKRKRKDSESEERKSKKHKSHRKHYSSDSDREESHSKRKRDSESSENEKPSKRRNDSESEEDRRQKSKKSRHRSNSIESKPKRSESSVSKSKDKTAKHDHDHESSSSKSKSKSDKKKDDKEEKAKSRKSRSHSSSDKDKSDDKKRDKHKTDSSRSKHHSKENEQQSKGSKSSSSSGSKRSSGKKTKDKTDDVKVIKVNNEKMINGIDSGSGASFAEALGMCGPLVTPKNKKKSSPPLTADKPHGSQAIPSSSKAHILEVPDLLQEPELEPLNLNIDNFLPEITPNYKPLGLPLDMAPKKLMTDDEALSRVMSNRIQKTKVYSGNKVRGKVESLFQICVRVLQDNIDALEYTGGVPFSILKPIIDRATPDQLFNLEHHNPYLIEDTNELWQLHCQKEFRTKQREEMESWREMYMRCLEEREARLSAITATIKQSQDKSLPVRTTKLAYVDSVAKPPRNIARKQVKNGIPNEQKPPKTASKLAALATAGDAGKVSVPNPGSRAADRSSGGTSSASVKPKKAPLMAKTLSFLKNRFRR